jgi:hypothetical protein
VAAVAASVAENGDSGLPRLTRGNLEAALEGGPPLTRFQDVAGPVSPRPTPDGTGSSEAELAEERQNEKVLFQLMERMYAVIQEIRYASLP